MSIRFSTTTSDPESEAVRISEVESWRGSTYSVVDPGSRYSFLPLDRHKNELRLLQLLPGQGADAIKCTLYLVSRNDRPLYSALSYAWENHSFVAPITVNDQEWFVTENLYLALLNLRNERSPLTLWVDAICIDQKNEEEKSWHVQQMRDTFREAEQVIVWLGPHAAGTDDAIRMLERIADVASALGPPESFWSDEISATVVASYAKAAQTALQGSEQSMNNDQDKSKASSTPLEGLFQDIVTRNQDGLHFLEPATSNIFSRPWWRRTWVVQELAVSSNIHMVCGTTWVLQPSMTIAAQLYYQYQTSIWAKEEREREGTQDQKCIYDELTSPVALRQQALYAQNTVRWAYLNWVTKPGLPLGFILSSTFAYGSTRVLEASDPRDYVFALLGLATDTAELGLHADYSKSNLDVYISLSRALVKQGQYVVLSWCRSESGTEAYLPSWVPDLAHKTHRPFQWVVYSPQADKFVLEPKYQASRGLRHARSSSVVPISDRVLQIYGVILDSVVSCGTSWAEIYKRHAPASDVIARVSIRWLRELKITVEDIAANEVYLNEEDKIEAVWQTSVAGIAMTPSWEKSRWTGPLSDIYWEMYLQNFPYEQMMKNIHTRGHLTLLDAINIGRRSFVSAKGYIGLGPVETLPGDKIVIVCGAQMPFVMREGEDGRMRLVGDTYVHGVMDGIEGAPELEAQTLNLY